MTKTIHPLILCCLITHPQNGGGKGRGRFFDGGRLFYISANRRGAYSNGALIRGGGEGALIRDFTVNVNL